MRRPLLVITGLLTATVLMAAPVTLQQAQQRAQQFAARRSAPQGRAMQLATQQPLHDAGQQAAYYVFNRPGGQGFVIVSGDDRTTPILAYADEGEFRADALPQNMQAWLQGYQDQLQWLAEHPAAQQAPAKAAIKNAIDPLLSTLWNQDKPYNLQCPVFVNGNRCVTGCVATAMAQVLYAHQPEGTTQEIAEYDCATNWGSRVHVDAKPVTNFDWTNILPVYESTATEAQQNAIATLMAYCGASVNMDYADAVNGGSGASDAMVAPALRNYFGMEAHYVSRDAYEYNGWMQLIYDELAAGRPVFYGGQSSGGGHAFVIDGFDGDELFHVNWGWGGHSNGYFALSVLTPGDNSGIGASSSNDGYSFGQDAVIGVKKGSTPEPAQMTFQSFTISGAKISFSVYNWSGGTNTFDIGLGYIDDESTITPITTLVSSAERNQNQGYSLSHTVDGSSKPAGTYKIVGISRVTGTETWCTQMNPWKDYIEAVFDGAGNVTLTRMPLAASLTVTGIEFPGSKYVNEVQPVNVTVSNSGGEFYGILYFFASQTSTKGDAIKGGATIAKGASITTQFSFTPKAEGNWNVWVATDEAGSNVIGESTVTISSSAYTFGDFMFSGMEIADSDTPWTTEADGRISLDVFTKQIAFTPTVKNRSGATVTSSGGLVFYFFLQKKVGDTFVDDRSMYGMSAYTSISADKEISYSQMTFSGLDYGTYRITLKTYDQGTSTYTLQDDRYTITITKAYPQWLADGTRKVVKTTADNVTVADDAVAVDLSSFDFTDVTPNSNPNTLYYLSSTQTVPSSLSGKNVVKGDVADAITITDGQAFYAPTAFTATTISYSRSFGVNYDPTIKGWNTLVLPFAPTSVTAGGTAVDWFRSSTDTDKQFWMMEFDSDGASQVYFTHAGTLQAYRPYIVAVPGSYYGAESLAGKTFVFSATDATVAAAKTAVRAGSNFKFYGTLTPATLTSAYALNTEGNTFKLGSSVSVEPFRAYFTSTGGATSMSIGIVDGGTTGLNLLPAAAREKASGVYTLSGTRVADSLEQLPAGIYIVNGKKVIK